VTITYGLRKKTQFLIRRCFALLYLMKSIHFSRGRARFNDIDWNEMDTRRTGDLYQIYPKFRRAYFSSAVKRLFI